MLAVKVFTNKERVVPCKFLSINAVIMDSGKVFEFKEWTEEEVREISINSLMKDAEDSPEVNF